MKKRVEKLFQNDTLVSVRDYEVKKCIDTNDVMHIEFGDEVMTLDPHSLENKQVLVSETFKSKFGGKGYKLISYKWNPNIRYDD